MTGVPDVSGALMTDLYELTMAAAHFAGGVATAPATFSLFVRSMPASRGYLVAAGLDDCLGVLESLRFTPDDRAALEALELFDAGFLDFLSGLRFTGSVRAVPEGRAVLAGEPLLEIDAPLAEGQVVETALLSHVGYQTAITTKAVRLRQAAAGRPVADFGMRSAPGGEASLRLARCARIAGLPSTSNVAGAVRYGLPASGTMGHSFIQAHGDELTAFELFARVFGNRTILLVDTYDALTGVGNAITVARRMRAEGTELAGIRIDSGDVAALARRARAMLDDAGFPDVKIFATGGLDEHHIAAFVADGVPVDGYGVGAALAVPPDAPALEAAYKLVEVAGRPVRKCSPGKATWPGRKQVWRTAGDGDVLALADEDPVAGAEPLLTAVMHGGRTPAGRADLAAAADRLAADLAALPEGARRLTGPEPPPVRVSAGLARMAAEVECPE